MDNIIKKNTLTSSSQVPNSNKYSSTEKHIDDYYGSNTNSMTQMSMHPQSSNMMLTKQRTLNKVGGAGYIQQPDSFTQLERINNYNNNVLGGITLAPSSSQVGASQSNIMEQIDN